jgi:DnaK suppressor protein
LIRGIYSLKGGGIREMAKKQDYGKFKIALQDERAKLVQGLDHLQRETLNQSQRDAAGDLSGYSLHMADMATDNFDREFTLGLASGEQELLNRIDEALTKFKDGTYGVCEACNKKITLKRLKAVPYAKLCIKCKEAEEKKPQ